jgi:NHL repeat-containing protein
MQRSFVPRRRGGLVAAFAAMVAMALTATSAWAGPGYELASTNSSIPLSAEIPVGVAVDQGTQMIYVAEVSTNLSSIAPGQVEQLNSSGTPTTDSPFGTGGQDLFISVAVNPLTHGIYAYQIQGSTPFGPKGVSMLSNFSSSGVLGTSFSPPQAEATTLAADASGRLLFPNTPTSSVQILSSSGTLEGSVTCGGACGSAFVKPQAVALDSAGHLYVVDRGNGRVVKFGLSGGSYVYESTLQSGAGAAAVAVDSSSGDVFVGDLVGSTYHVVAYDSSGTEFDDFGAGLVTPSQLEVITGQLAVNSTTHNVYLSNPGGDDLLVFERIASIPAPTASVAAPSPVGQVSATLRATVNPKGHVLSTCKFEYTDHADFLANGFSNAHSASCPSLLGQNQDTAITAAVNGLTPGTDYDYRIRIASHGGSTEAGPQAFETLPPLPPESTTGSATAVTKTSATLAGSVNPKGGLVSNCHFEWVTEAAFQATGFTGASSKACTPLPTGNAASPVSAAASGLTPGTTYRFRVVATSNSGTGTALPATFSTTAETCSDNSALCPPSGEGSLPPASSPPPPAVTPPPVQKKPLKCRKGFRKKKIRGKQRCVRVKKHRPQH